MQIKESAENYLETILVIHMQRDIADALTYAIRWDFQSLPFPYI